MVEVANDYRDFTFAIADEEDYSNRLKDFGLEDSGEDINVALLDEKDRKYNMDDEFSEDSLRDFLDAYKNGKCLYYYYYYWKYNTLQKLPRIFEIRMFTFNNIFL